MGVPQTAWEWLQFIWYGLTAPKAPALPPATLHACPACGRAR